MPKLSFKERERQRREAEILRVAAHIINERGYAQLNMDEVAEEVGVSKPTLYQHFSSKDEMVIGTMTRSMDHMAAFMDSVQDQRPIQQMEAILRYLLRTHTEPDELPATLVHEESVVQHSTFAAMMQQRQQLGNRLLKIIEAGQAAGEIPAGLPPIIVMSSMFAMLDVLYGAAVIEDAVSFHADQIEGIVQVYLHGIST